MSHSLPEDKRQSLGILASILLRCFLITIIALLFVWGTLLAFGDFFYPLPSIWFDVSRQNDDLLLLYALTFINPLNLVFFLFPYLAIKHDLQRPNPRNHDQPAT